jgi:hypothetical protein
VAVNVRLRMTSVFACVSKSEWAVSDRMRNSCRALLHSARPFEALVRELCCNIEVVRVCRNKSRDFPGYFRASVKVRVLRRPCTAFHSARCGYRAQYYSGVRNGEKANAFAVRSLVNAIRMQLCGTRLMTKEWIERSLFGNDSKVWIHQGQWLRRGARLLLVSRWIDELRSDDWKRQKLARWATLVPERERRIDIKGTWITLGGDFLSVKAKPKRATHLHELGFT